ncbi:MAG: DUF4347 domain-containing protein [Acidobacteria bacterium]|nr:MAG: DUF4347 domain-containing protein [Acidobacteriota bacterium]REJ99286.1 MAG: DUF4347 domain-containing protein [Acidobacteriota bacterium]REK15993.1 MAG: DUF4347 domain-containing protein [Acidobacteriota bacterium]REK43674.1 MAG: DUF4347 domain-containing protein [Acidobacteriota bacterium]
MIYDAADYVSSHEAKSFKARYKFGAWVVDAAGINCVSELTGALAGYTDVTQLDFCTHGCSGEVGFKNGTDLSISTLKRVKIARSFFGPQRFDKNYAAKLLFMGCETAKGSQGRRFLEAAGRHFLSGKGGFVGGTKISNFYPFVGNTRVPPGGQLVVIQFDVNGKIIGEKTVKAGLIGSW